MFRVNNKNTKTASMTCLNLTIETLGKVVTMFKVNNKNNRATSLTSFWCLYCQLQRYFTPSSKVYIVDFKQVMFAGDKWLFKVRNSKKNTLFKRNTLLKTFNLQRIDNQGNIFAMDIKTFYYSSICSYKVKLNQPSKHLFVQSQQQKHLKKL